MLTISEQCGGSTGHVSVKLASKHPNLTLIVQDFESLRASFDVTVPPPLRDRVSFQAHDFYTPQTVKDADVYFFKHVFHDWSDSFNAGILRNLIPAMKKGSRVIVMDAVLPEAGEVPNMSLKRHTVVDLLMMLAANAKERKKQDWVDIFKMADERFVVKAFKQPLGSSATLIDVVFDE